MGMCGDSEFEREWPRKISGVLDLFRRFVSSFQAENQDVSVRRFSETPWNPDDLVAKEKAIIVAEALSHHDEPLAYENQPCSYV